MYAIIETGGKQYKVSVDETVFIEKLDVAAAETVTFDKVLLVSAEKLLTGDPYVKGANVVARLEKHGKGKKVRIFKMKSKKGYRRRLGHRQPYSKVVITAINI